MYCIVEKPFDAIKPGRSLRRTRVSYAAAGLSGARRSPRVSPFDELTNCGREGNYLYGDGYESGKRKFSFKFDELWRRPYVY
ncbi:hypothetical protein EVAR_23875_1 [Eumeta japonica]|uniref:Uncharacterized protein n=1 Tax=Eumeta variegata TaxID=151549 RepID=A0A4C1V5C1_EUMVA|nr:hypothetical protein EVAR_23875_1 [Eumeta japonica]